MKLELYNFLPRPDPGVAHGPGLCLPRPVARPTFTSTISLPPVSPSSASPADLHVVPVLTPCSAHCSAADWLYRCTHEELETGLGPARPKVMEELGDQVLFCWSYSLHLGSGLARAAERWLIPDPGAAPPQVAGAMNCGSELCNDFANAIWRVFKVFISAKLWAGPLL